VADQSSRQLRWTEQEQHGHPSGKVSRREKSFRGSWILFMCYDTLKMRLLNLVKIRFHNTDNFTFKYDANKNDMLAVFGQCEDVSVVEAEDDIF
jgi:hypothetical protein